MPISQFQLYLDTLTHPMTLFYITRNKPFLNNEFVNHTLDLLALLKMMPRDGVPRLDAIKKFFVTDENLPAQLQMGTLAQMRAQYTQSSTINDQFLLSCKRYTLLKMIAMQSQDDYEKITRLFTNTPNALALSREEYDESLAVLCRVLKSQLAQINGVTSNVPMHTPVDHYAAMDNLVVALKQTQRIFACYDDPERDYTHAFTESLEARHSIYRWTVGVALAVNLVVHYSLNNSVGFAVGFSLLACFMLYKCLQELQALHTLHVTNEAMHKTTETQIRHSLGLPDPEPEFIAEPVVQPNAVKMMFMNMYNKVKRQDALTYNPLDDKSKKPLLNNDDEQEGTIKFDL